MIGGVAISVGAPGILSLHGVAVGYNVGSVISSCVVVDWFGGFAV